MDISRDSYIDIVKAIRAGKNATALIDVYDTEFSKQEFTSTVTDMLSYLRNKTDENLRKWVLSDEVYPVSVGNKAMFVIALILHIPYLLSKYDSLKIENSLCIETVHELINKMDIALIRGRNPIDINLDWLERIFTFNIVRLGRLQFSFNICKEDVIVQGKQECLDIHRCKSFYEENSRILLEKGCRFLEVHIPEGEKLDIMECQNSFDLAEKMMSHLNLEYNGFVCKSWIMSEDLEKYLNDEWNLVKFRKLFTRFPCDRPVNEILYRVFYINSIQELKNVVCKSRLQKRLYKALLDGETIDGGGGYRSKGF